MTIPNIWVEEAHIFQFAYLMICGGIAFYFVRFHIKWNRETSQLILLSL